MNLVKHFKLFWVFGAAQQNSTNFQRHPSPSYYHTHSTRIVHNSYITFYCVITMYLCDLLCLFVTYQFPLTLSVSPNSFYFSLWMCIYNHLLFIIQLLVRLSNSVVPYGPIIEWNVLNKLLDLPTNLNSFKIKNSIYQRP